MSSVLITSEEAASLYGITARHEAMPNGENRFRLMGSDGNGYIRTVAGQAGSWQKAHSHPDFREAYVVESGWMGIARPHPDNNSQLLLARIGAGEMWVTIVGEPHNVYLPARAIIHTVKFGVRNVPGQWVPEPALDDLTSRIEEASFASVGPFVGTGHN